MTVPSPVEYSPFRRFHHIEVAVADHHAAARDWSKLFDTPVLEQGGGTRIAVGDSWIEFTPSGGPTILTVAVEVDDPGTAASHAEAQGASVSRDAGTQVVRLNGVSIELRPADGGVPAPGHLTFTRFHHVVVAVRDDESAIRLWSRVFPFQVAPEGPDGLLLRHHVPVGDAWFGLTSTGTDGDALGRYLERRGEGVYALALVVADRSETARTVASRGGRVIGDPADYQMFVHPASTHGILVELANEWPGGIRRPPP
jgi:hypothetical protein